MKKTSSCIQSGVVYPLAEFERITGLKRHAMRQARKQGLRVCRLGNRAYVRGEDFSEFLHSKTVQQAG